MRLNERERIRALGPFDPDKTDYTATELNDFATLILREDADTERCSECGEAGTESDAGELECVGGHRWSAGEGRTRGIAGENPILFAEHYQYRKNREVYPQVGYPDPSLFSGIFGRAYRPDHRTKHKTELDDE